MNNQRLATDTFASGALAGGWSAALTYAESQIVGSLPYYAEPTALSTNCAQVWTGTAFPNDHASEATVQTLTSEGGTTLGLLIRMQSGGALSGYEAAIGQGSAVFYIITAGTRTQLGSTATGVTVAAGDVFSFQAAGSLLSLYHNNTYVYSWYDATYSGGSPGFLQFSSVALTHCQVASWRGYSAVQQDGIWQRQGILIAPIASELGGSSQGHQNPYIIVEGNPVVLAGTAPVFKMWFSAGFPVNICYAESYTGLPGTWVRYSGNPILSTGYYWVSIFKHGGTYYLFTQSSGDTVALYTSANGVTGFTLQSSSCLGVGTTGTWDVYAIGYFAPIYFDGTTLYATYSGWAVPGAGTGGINTGLATSVAPFTVWTKYTGNPVVNNFWGLTVPYVVGSTFYFWGQSNNPGRNSGASGIDPAEGVRYQTTFPFTSWTNKTHSIHSQQQYMGTNLNSGGGFMSQIIPVGTQTYLYCDNSVADSVAGEGYQIDMAISNLPISAIIAGREDGTAQVASDNFTAGIGALAGNWTTITGAASLQIVAGNLVQAPSASTNAANIYTGATFGANQYSEITPQALASGTTYAIPLIRAQASGTNWYSVNIHGAIGSVITISISKSVAGVTTPIGPTALMTPHVGDVLRMTANGSSPVLLTFTQNDYQVLQVEDWSNAFTTGYPGIQIFTSAVAGSQIAGWGGGNAGINAAAMSQVTGGDVLAGSAPNTTATATLAHLTGGDVLAASAPPMSVAASIAHVVAGDVFTASTPNAPATATITHVAAGDVFAASTISAPSTGHLAATSFGDIFAGIVASRSIASIVAACSSDIFVGSALPPIPSSLFGSIDPDAATIVGGTLPAPVPLVTGQPATIALQCRVRGAGAIAVFNSTDILTSVVIPSRQTVPVFAPTAAWFTDLASQSGWEQGQPQATFSGAQMQLLEPSVRYTLIVWRALASAPSDPELIARMVLSIEPLAIP
jgi:hypothetical protein